MEAQDLDAVALLVVFAATGVAVALVLAIIAGSVAALLALAQGRSKRSYMREWAAGMPKAILIVSALSAGAIATYAVAFGR